MFLSDFLDWILWRKSGDDWAYADFSLPDADTCRAMPVIELTDAELRYLRKLNQDNLEVMEFMAKKKALELPDRKLAHQLKAKFDLQLPVREKWPKRGSESRGCG
jgi:hypothetical protein